ncbi:hypothetical protein ILYODFUR_009272 [Ilyodon furcidens]|uniref:Uncharacterized protein n=1 Tax=Ilyodon furcidens TaxID=33524 RepID=A0ABV0SJS5_9TELE
MTTSRSTIPNSGKRGQAGGDYKKEVQELRRQMSQKKASKVHLTSGVDLPYYTVIHSPIAAYNKGENLKNYREKMWVALEEGLNAVINHSLRRTICLDGLRSHDLPWESAEKVAVATAYHVVKNLLTDASLTEIVNSLSQHEGRRKRELVLV